MKTRRWMKIILEEAKAEQIEKPWSRNVRKTRNVAKSQTLTAAE